MFTITNDPEKRPEEMIEDLEPDERDSDTVRGGDGNSGDGYPDNEGGQGPYRLF
jgi:hypothetical protein